VEFSYFSHITFKNSKFIVFGNVCQEILITFYLWEKLLIY